MTDRKTVLLIGLDPAVVDYAKWPGLTPEKLQAALEGDARRMDEAGFAAQLCFIDHGETAAATVEAALAQNGLRRHHDRRRRAHRPCRVPPLRAAAQRGPRKGAQAARICFNTGPTDSLDAVKRWA